MKQAPFTQYHSNESATINGKSAKGWVMYNSKEVDPIFKEMSERISWLERIKEYGKRGDYLKMEMEILGYEGNCNHAHDPFGDK